MDVKNLKEEDFIKAWTLENIFYFFDTFSGVGGGFKMTIQNTIYIYIQIYLSIYLSIYR